MADKNVSEHERKLRLGTLGVVGMLAVLCGAMLLGTGLFLYMSFVGEVIWWQGMILVAMGCPMGIISGFVVFRFVHRMFAVKRIRLLEGKRLEVITWRGKSYMAVLPEAVEYWLPEQDDWTVGLRVDNRVFVVSSAEFVGSERVMEFLKVSLIGDKP